MFSDPQSVTVNAVAESLPRISSGDLRSTYRSSDGEFTLNFSHDEKNVCRRTVRLAQTLTAADPLLDGVSRQYNGSAHLVITHPKVGLTATQIKNLVQGLVDYVDTPGVIEKIIAGES